MNLKFLAVLLIFTLSSQNVHAQNETNVTKNITYPDCEECSIFWGISSRFRPLPIEFDITWLGNCSASAVEAETLEQSGYVVNCKLPWNVSEPEVFFLQMMTNITDKVDGLEQQVSTLSEEKAALEGVSLTQWVVIIVLGIIVAYIVVPNILDIMRGPVDTSFNIRTLRETARIEKENKELRDKIDELSKKLPKPKKEENLNTSKENNKYENDKSS